jgi:hypothetical protein
VLSYLASKEVSEGRARATNNFPFTHS